MTFSFDPLSMGIATRLPGRGQRCQV